MTVRLKLWISLIVLGLLAVFVLQNTTVVEIRVLLWTFALSRSLMVLIVLVLGLLVGWLLHGYAAYRRTQVKTGGK